MIPVLANSIEEHGGSAPVPKYVNPYATYAAGVRGLFPRRLLHGAALLFIHPYTGCGEHNNLASSSDRMFEVSLG